MGCYIVEFEQNGEDRAAYGEQLLKKLEQRLKTKGLNERALVTEYATAGLDPNIFVQKYMIELPSEEEIKEFIASSNY